MKIELTKIHLIIKETKRISWSDSERIIINEFCKELIEKLDKEVKR